MRSDPKPEKETAGKLRAAGCDPLDGSRRRATAEEGSHARGDHLRTAPGRSRQEDKRRFAGRWECCSKPSTVGSVAIGFAFVDAPSKIREEQDTSDCERGSTILPERDWGKSKASKPSVPGRAEKRLASPGTALATSNSAPAHSSGVNLHGRLEAGGIVLRSAHLILQSGRFFQLSELQWFVWVE